MKNGMNKLVGASGAFVMSIAVVSLFSAMGASGAALAKAEINEQAQVVVKLDRVEVIGKRSAVMAVNTHGVKARTL